jgi:hypothetical protein
MSCPAVKEWWGLVFFFFFDFIISNESIYPMKRSFICCNEGQMQYEFFFLMVLTKGKETNMTAQKQDIVFKFNSVVDLI